LVRALPLPLLAMVVVRVGDETASATDGVEAAT
jgi:hypothetical protein